MKHIITDEENESWIVNYNVLPIKWKGKNLDFILYQTDFLCFKASQMERNEGIIFKAIELKRPIVIIKDLYYLPYESKEFFICNDSKTEIEQMFQYAYLYGKN